jgi:hypothetical protein
MKAEGAKAEAFETPDSEPQPSAFQPSFLLRYGFLILVVLPGGLVAELFLNGFQLLLEGFHLLSQGR